VFADGIPVLRVSGAGETPDVRRLYDFYPQDYPALYHERAVERERSLECYLEIYEHLNGPINPAARGQSEERENN
jgi:hypothetical protein